MRARQGCPVRVNIKRSFVAWCHQVGRWASGEHYKAGSIHQCASERELNSLEWDMSFTFSNFDPFFEISSNTANTHNSCHNGQPYMIVHNKLNTDVLV